jgi:isoleucyl-tRNA synthetase
MSEQKSTFILEEEKVQTLWNEKRVFEKSLEESKNDPTFTFYDGPPFATGLPHYGHILAGFIKDTIGRWATMDGKYVQRIAGWDQHGLPIEYEIEKKLGIKTKKQIEELGLVNYNAACKEIVMSCADDWKSIMNRLGRWIDFENAYKTSDIEFMSKTWNVFAKLYEKGLIYQGIKVMPYSLACTTPLSNFEASSNYQDVIDRTIIVKFRVFNKEERLKENRYILVWTTTPWTLFANYVIALNPDFVYLLIKYNDEEYYISKERLSFISEKLKIKESDFTILEEICGKDLIGINYVPLYEINGIKYTSVHDYFPDINKLYKTYGDSFVTNDSGTGFVHIAPAFGEEDYNVVLKNDIIRKDSIVYDHLDENGYTKYCGLDEYYDIFPKNIFYKDLNGKVIKNLKERNLLLTEFQYNHSYPFCWRSDTPLIYRAVKSWFLNVEPLKERMKELNKSIYWYPDYVGSGRFAQWLNGTRDWCISRNRYWGTPIPIWIAEDGEKLIIHNKEHLEFLTGMSITDLHRDTIDNIVIEVKGKQFKRISEIFDCWFESGSVPYASPTTGYPAQFIAEGLDQTRGWFYTLLVLGTALEDKSPYESVIVNGLVLAADGKKMSKRLKNYPDPMTVVNKYGSDALRFYLLTSVAVKGEPLRFVEDGVKQVLQNILIPLSNSVNFFIEYNQLFGEKIHFENVEETTLLKRLNTLDDYEYIMNQELNDWIQYKTNIFTLELHSCYQKYHLDKIGILVQNYIEDLNNVYIKLNRNDIKGKHDVKGQIYGLYTLYNVLKRVLCVLAPILPFFTESMNMKLFEVVDKHSVYTYTVWRGLEYQSIHLQKFKNITPFFFNHQSIKNVEFIEILKTMIEEVRNVRTIHKIPNKRPLRKVVFKIINNQNEYIVNFIKNFFESKASIFEDECNILEGEIDWNENNQMEVINYKYECKLDFKKCGKEFRHECKDFEEFIKSMDQNWLKSIYDGNILYYGYSVIKNNDLIIVTRKEDIKDDVEYVTIHKGDYMMKVYIQSDSYVEQLYEMKNIATTFQKMRKDAKLHPWDDVRLVICNQDKEFQEKVNKHKYYIYNVTRTYIEVVDVLNEIEVDKIIFKNNDYYILEKINKHDLIENNCKEDSE